MSDAINFTSLIKKSLISDEPMQERNGKINRSFKTNFPVTAIDKLDALIEQERPLIQTADKKWYEIFIARVNDFRNESYIQLIGSPVNVYANSAKSDELEDMLNSLVGTGTAKAKTATEAGFASKPSATL